MGLSLFFSSTIFGSENSLKEVKLVKDFCKMKVDLSDISFQKNGMYCLLENSPVKISSLQCKNGEYTAITSKGIVEDVLGVWWCYNCRHWNSKFDSICAFCAHPR